MVARHPDHEVGDRPHDREPVHSLRRERPLLIDESSVSAQNRLGRHDRRELFEEPPAKRDPTDAQTV